MHLQFLGRVSLFLFFFSLPALMQPLEPAGCSTAQDKPTESILTAAKNSPQKTLSAIFVSAKQTQDDPPAARLLSTLSVRDFPQGICRP